MSRRYTVQHFIDKFTAIPSAKWRTALMGDAGGPRCALGHCLTRSGKMGAESNALSALFHATLLQSIIIVNDGQDEKYPQPTPKKRVLAALRNIQRLQARVEK